MKTILENLLNLIGIKSNRTKNITKHIFFSFLYKAGAVLAGFLIVPLTIKYLDTENYGVWLTLSSFFGWINLLDIGLDKGLRNKFAEARTNNNHKLAQAYISTAYYSISVLSLSLFFLFLVVNYAIDWSIVFNSNEKIGLQLSVLMPIVFLFFSLRLTGKLIMSIYLGDQNHSILVKVDFFTQLLSLICIWVLLKVFSQSLLLYGSIFSAIPVVVLIGFNLLGFSKKYKDFRPLFSLVKRKYLNEIMGLGLEFFIIQISVLVLFSTDNFIISLIYSPEEVVPYTISLKYFSILTMVYTMIVTPYWSSFTEAFIVKDFDWIKGSVHNILKIWLCIPILLILMVFFSNEFYKFWIGSEIHVPFRLSFSMALFTMFFTFNLIFTYFLNGVGKIRLQLITAIASLIINIPLSIFFAKTLNLGTSGVILATTFSLLIYVIFRPIQYFRIIKGKARGIWNK